MITFEFDTETHLDGVPYSRTLYWLGCTSCIDDDEQHTAEIYEQLDAQASGLCDE